MPIDLSAYETGAKLSGSYDKQLSHLQDRLAHLQSLHIAHNARTLILFEGWELGGKGEAIKRVTARLDPRYVQAFPIAAATAEEAGKHFLWRFWSKLPGPRQIHVWDHSHYRRVLAERIEGLCTEAEWRRGYDEINEFESQQVETGTNLIKILLHITAQTQNKLLREKLDDPSKAWSITQETVRNIGNREAYLAAATDMFRLTDTRWAPWKVIDANNTKAANITVLEHIAAKLEEHLPKEFPKADPAVKALAKKALGKKR
jgi:AMP-polyphosphate phosphotransferase